MLLENLQLFRLTNTGQFKDNIFIAPEVLWSEDTNFCKLYLYCW